MEFQPSIHQGPPPEPSSTSPEAPNQAASTSKAERSVIHHDREGIKSNEDVMARVNQQVDSIASNVTTDIHQVLPHDPLPIEGALPISSGGTEKKIDGQAVGLIHAAKPSFAPPQADALTALQKLHTTLQEIDNKIENLSRNKDQNRAQIEGLEKQRTAIRKMSVPTLERVCNNPAQFGDLIDRDFKAALTALKNVSNGEEVAKNLVNAMGKEISEEQMGKLMNAHVEEEVGKCASQPTLFRETAGTMGAIRKQFQAKLLGGAIGVELDASISKNVLHKKVGALSEQNIGADGVAHGTKSIEQKEVMKRAGNILNDLETATREKPMPKALKSYYQTIYRESIKKWGKEATPIQHIHGQVMLVGVCPTTLLGSSRTGFGQVDYTPQDSQNGTQISKTLQSVANNQRPTDPRMNKIAESGFIEAHQKLMEQIVMNLIR